MLRIRLSDLPIAREVAQGRHVHVAYAANGTVVELVLLQARAQGWLPLHVKLRLPRSPAIGEPGAAPELCPGVGAFASSAQHHG